MSFNDLAKKEGALKKASGTNAPKPQAVTKDSPVPARDTDAQPKS